jgi:hypothetical protein
MSRERDLLAGLVEAVGDRPPTTGSYCALTAEHHALIGEARAFLAQPEVPAGVWQVEWGELRADEVDAVREALKDLPYPPTKPMIVVKGITLRWQPIEASPGLDADALWEALNSCEELQVNGPKDHILPHVRDEYARAVAGEPS